MQQKKKQIVTALLCHMDEYGFDIFEEIPYLELIKPLVKLDRQFNRSYQQIANKYDITYAQARNIVRKILSSSDKDNKAKHS